MNPDAIVGIQNSRREMQTALSELAASRPMLSTQEAVACCPLGSITAETLIAYPMFVLPRVVMCPGAKRPTYRWDPRDLHALPSVLRRWQEAITSGTQADFERERREELRARDLRAMNVAGDLREAA